MKVTAALAAARIEPREARLLLAEACGISTAAVLAHPERELSEAATARFGEMAARRRAGEPVAYLLGRREFYGLAFEVTPAVLIPRPETELLVDLALRRGPSTVLDLGTGCGAIALAIKHCRPQARVVAVDASASALAVARRNAAMHSMEIDFRHGEWFAPVPGERFAVVIANPPYVATGDPHLAQGDLRFEPREALVSGPEGLDAIREIVRQAPPFLLPGGWLLLEHGAGQDEAVRTLLLARGFDSVSSWPDLAGIARASGGRLKSD